MGPSSEICAPYAINGPSAGIASAASASHQNRLANAAAALNRLSEMCSRQCLGKVIEVTRDLPHLFTNTAATSAVSPMTHVPSRSRRARTPVVSASRCPPQSLTIPRLHSWAGPLLDRQPVQDKLVVGQRLIRTVPQRQTNPSRSQVVEAKHQRILAGRR